MCVLEETQFEGLVLWKKSSVFIGDLLSVLGQDCACVSDEVALGVGNSVCIGRGAIQRICDECH